MTTLKEKPQLNCFDLYNLPARLSNRSGNENIKYRPVTISMTNARRVKKKKCLYRLKKIGQLQKLPNGMSITALFPDYKFIVQNACLSDSSSI
jgi:hypothetical protein